MRHNMGKAERGIGLVGSILVMLVSLIMLNGGGVLYGVFTAATITGFALTVAGIVVFVTGISGYCPINAMLHINSCEACKLGETHKHMPV